MCNVYIILLYIFNVCVYRGDEGRGREGVFMTRKSKLYKSENILSSSSSPRPPPTPPYPLPTPSLRHPAAAHHHRGGNNNNNNIIYVVRLKVVSEKFYYMLGTCTHHIIYI